MNDVFKFSNNLMNRLSFKNSLKKDNLSNFTSLKS